MRRRHEQHATAAIVLERQKEIHRLSTEKHMVDPALLKETIRVHNEERTKFRTYLSTMQYDNEIVLIQKMAEIGIIW